MYQTPLKDIVRDIRGLEPFPAVVTRVIELASRDDVVPNDLLDVMRTDLGITCKALKVCNSAFYGLRREVASLRDAGNLLGVKTLVNLVLRFFDPDQGRVLIDGQDLAACRQESVRAQIAMVTQDTALLHRSIRDNIRYGRPDATEEEVWDAARRVRADEFVPNLVDQLGREAMDAHVGERGVRLSGGQRQRVALARAVLKDAPILILDEATSALDSEVEAAIQDSLEELMAGKTVIAIAHRLSTIQRMDRIVVLDDGRIVEQGSHAELLAAEGLYARLWARQSGGFIGWEAAE